MPWEKAFDRNEALEKATMVFWRNGYANTSMADIVAATGASRYGLYDEFGDKHALYLAALGHYEANPIAWLLGDLEAPGAGLTAIRGYRDRLLASTETPHGRLGCLMTLSAADLCPHDPKVCATVNSFFERVHQAIAAAFQNARAASEWHSKLTPDEAAEVILGAVQGAAVFARAEVAPQTIARTLRNTFAQILNNHPA